MVDDIWDYIEEEKFRYFRKIKDKEKKVSRLNP
jgi:hypothetical protein